MEQTIDSIQNQRPQQTLKLSLVRLKALLTGQKQDLFRSFWWSKLVLLNFNQCAFNTMKIWE